MVGRPARLDSLTGLRFAAALLVFGRHLEPYLLAHAPAVRWLLLQGSVGVGFFFILSGFVLTWSHRPDDTARSVWRRRVAKVYPNHAVTWLLMLGVLLSEHQHVTPTAAGLNLMLLQSWVPSESTWLSINSVSWSLSCEAFFYLMLPLLVAVVANRRRSWIAAVVALLVILALPYLTPLLISEGRAQLWIVYAFPAARLPEFVIGIAMARLLMLDALPRIRLSWGIALTAFGYLFAAVPLNHPRPYLPELVAYSAVTVVPFAVLIVAAAQADMSGRRWPFRHPWAVTLGNWSFAFYLVHYNVIAQSARMGWLESLSGILAMFLPMLAVSLALAAALYTVVEVPAYRLIRRRGQKARSKEAAIPVQTSSVNLPG